MREAFETASHGAQHRTCVILEPLKSANNRLVALRVWFVAIDPGRTHRFYVGPPPLFPFGHGLSYTSFGTRVVAAWRLMPAAEAAVGWPTSHKLREMFVAETKVEVTHLGGPAGTEVVLLFAAPPEGAASVGEGAPRQSLIGFARVPVRVGETNTVTFRINALTLSYAKPDGNRTLPPGAWTLWAGPQRTGEVSLRL